MPCRDRGEVCEIATFDTLTDGRTVEACGSAKKKSLSETMPLVHVSNEAENLSFIANSSLNKGYKGFDRWYLPNLKM
jgi:hypothetical protein